MPAARTPNHQHVREILKTTESSRDALPYSEEFERHFAGFAGAAGTPVTRQQFWRSLSSAAKNGGWKGKKRGEPAPDLDHQQEDALRQLLAGRLGSRDSLPYSPAFDHLREQFNKASGLALADRPFWRAVCSVCKQPLRADVDRLLAQAVDSLTNAVDHFNRSSDQGRPASVLIFLLHASELLLKAGLLQRGCDIREPSSGYTFSFDTCLNRGTDDASLKFLTGDERSTLRVLNGLRDHAQHYLVDVSEQVLYTVAQSTFTLFGKLVARLFGIALAERLPRRVLPLSTDPPRSIHIVMDEEFSQLRGLLETGKEDDRLRAEAKLRCLMAVDRALEDRPIHVPADELAAAQKGVTDAAAWDEVFAGIARLSGLDRLKYPPKIHCLEVNDKVAEWYEAKSYVATLSFFDPFGYAGLSARLIRATLKDAGSECVFFLNFNRVNAAMTTTASRNTSSGCSTRPTPTPSGKN